MSDKYITVITCTDVYQVRDTYQNNIEMYDKPRRVSVTPSSPLTEYKKDERIIVPVNTFCTFKEGQEEPEFFKMAWHPDFEDTLGIAMSVFEQQVRNVAEYYDRIGNLQHIKINLELKLVDFDNLSFWGRLKFLFRGSIDHE